MKLHEFFSYRLSINESAGNIIRLLKMSPEFANRIHQIFGHLDFTVAKIVLSVVQEMYDNPAIAGLATNPIRIDDTIMDGLTGYPLHGVFGEDINKESAEGMGKHIKDFFNVNKALVPKINGAKIGNDVLTIVSSVQKKKQDDRSSLIMDLPGGWKWIDLGTCNDAAEAREMQHCGNDPRGNLVSLRDTYNNARVTMTYNAKDNVVYQIKGKQNQPPGQPFWPSVKAFLDKTNAKYNDPEIDGDLKDLLKQHELPLDEVDIIADGGERVWIQMDNDKDSFIFAKYNDAVVLVNATKFSEEKVQAIWEDVDVAEIDEKNRLHNSGYSEISFRNLKLLFLGLVKRGIPVVSFVYNGKVFKEKPKNEAP